jgi:predicted RNA methylase
MRSAARLKLGYYPLPPSEGDKLREMLVFGGQPASVIDPCAGTGAALLQITSQSNSRRYAVELDANRAEAASAAGIETIQGNFFDTHAVGGQFSLLYLNPPYDSELGPFDNKRMEQIFLENSYRWLRQGGILVFVIPANRLQPCTQLLGCFFSDVRVFRLKDQESIKYDQIVVFGVRKNMRGTVMEKNVRRLESYARQWSGVPIPEFDPATAGEPYLIPPSEPAKIEYRGIPVDIVEDLLPLSNSWKQVGLHLLPEDEINGGRPITPLHGGHVALLCAAGLLNGVFGKGKQRHIARWRAVKHTKKTVEQDEKTTIIHHKERLSSELQLIFADGRTQFLTPNPQQENEDEKRAA